MSNLPTGTFTFLFTDLEGSTKLAQQHPATWEAVRQRHHAILCKVIDAPHGVASQMAGAAGLRAGE